ncbi:hypothetical protein HNQ57_002597 [Zhongshania antarctica]|uniref:DUF262 domain-containing protein n=1 Tax=Zhongshania antarctica TaxID=641702 RepID=A0A840R709_9GAMM|nr:DUF262 domain-containing protein [Zhongshania antarctica]MBB5188318.1 hypothetical protein [Zhongshania antarctica]
MDAKARDLNQIFDGTISFQIPLFQRPYVWEEEKNWEPLWEDIQVLLDQHLRKKRSRGHFLGAVVLEQMKNVAGSISTHQVIDGQQRFTTLQIFMIAARDLCSKLNSEKYFERFNDLVTNKASKVDYEHECYKVWPTNSDRAAFKLVHASGGLDELNERLIDEPSLATENQQVIGGYRYFYCLLRDWISGALDEDDEKTVELDERLDALWQVIGNALQVVVINLDDDDESQVIFETLNARGTQLLPADLIKNYLFRRAQSQKEDIERLYDDYWKSFDAKFWRTEVKQGRVKRPRIDLFLQHYLTLMIRDDVRTAHIFEAFKDYVINSEDSGLVASSLSAQPTTIDEHLKALARYSRAFRTFSEPPVNSRLALFLQRLEAIDTATVYPLLLLACDQLLPGDPAEFDRLLQVLESFLVRRMVCSLTSKNYNRLFVDVIKGLDKEGRVSAEALRNVLQSYSGESMRFPDDAEFRNAILRSPLYKWLAQYKVRAVLAGVDRALQDRKSEYLEMPDNLTIEHVLPNSWQENWPLPTDLAIDPDAKVEFIAKRNVIKHTLGNLTLITGSLNPSLSNSGWEKKRPELVKFSKLNLNRYFYPVSGADDLVALWDESAIEQRGRHLFETACLVWPYE